MANEKSFFEKLSSIQAELKAPKNLYNSFGKYKYRNVEGINEAVKPLLKEAGLVLTLDDEIVPIGDRIYIKVTATITDGKEAISTHAFAREDDQKKGMDGAQVTGSCSSYARKYALNGLLLLDDTQDQDASTATPDSENKSSSSKGKSKPSLVRPIVDELREKLKAENVDEAMVCKLYFKDNKHKLDDMTDSQAQNAIDHLDAIKEKVSALSAA